MALREVESLGAEEWWWRLELNTSSRGGRLSEQMRRIRNGEDDERTLKTVVCWSYA